MEGSGLRYTLGDLVVYIAILLGDCGEEHLWGDYINGQL